MCFRERESDLARSRDRDKTFSGFRSGGEELAIGVVFYHRKKVYGNKRRNSESRIVEFRRKN